MARLQPETKHEQATICTSVESKITNQHATCACNCIYSKLCQYNPLQARPMLPVEAQVIWMTRIIHENDLSPALSKSRLPTASHPHLTQPQFGESGVRTRRVY